MMQRVRITQAHKDGANVRAGKSLATGIVAVVHRGDDVMLEDDGTLWHRIQTTTQSGYIASYAIEYEVVSDAPRASYITPPPELVIGDSTRETIAQVLRWLADLIENGHI